MGLTMSERRAVTKTIATRYKRAGKATKGVILDELCATTGWHRNHARKALAAALQPRIFRPAPTPRAPTYDADTVAALRLCWAVLGAPTGKRLAPVIGELVPILRRFEELTISDDTAAALVAMSAATMDRRLAADRAKLLLKGRSHTKPGSLLKSQIPIRTWAQWDDAVPGFLEIDLVGHEGGNVIAEHCYTLTVTDIATGWTENRSVHNKARRWVLEALEDIASNMPFPVRGVDSDNGSEFINHHLLDWRIDGRRIEWLDALAFANCGMAQKFDRGRDEALVALGRRAMGRWGGLWIERLRRVDGVDERSIVERAPGMSEARRTFIVRLLTENRRRLVES